MDQFYARAKDELGMSLLALGFTEKSLEFRRNCESGFDRVTIALVERKRFSVLLSYYPDYLGWVYKVEIAPDYDPSFGYPCGPYLNPVRVDARPNSWGIKDAPQTAKSFSQAKRALEQVGLPWLHSLKDARVYADTVMKSNFAFYGAALAAAGRLGEARVQFLRRIHILQRCAATPQLPIAERALIEQEIDVFKSRIARFDESCS